jgi:SNF2 family DNA or RNA helicase
MHGKIAYFPNEAPYEPRMPEWRVEAMPDVMIRLKRLFPRAERNKKGLITMSATDEISRELAWVLQRYTFEMTEEDKALLQQGAARHVDKLENIVEILSGRRTFHPVREPARPAYDFQLTAAAVATQMRRLLIGDDFGLGKTTSCMLLFLDPEHLPALIVCQAHLPLQMQRELAIVLPWLSSHVINRMRPYDVTRRNGGKQPDVLIMSYSKLRGWEDHLPGHVRTVVFDETQELRRHRSDKYQAAGIIASDADVVVGATATPVYNYGAEIHNIYGVVAPDALGDREEFAREWCGGYWNDKARVVDPEALGVHLRESGLLIRRTRKEVGRELPDVIRVPEAVDSDEKIFDRLAQGTFDLATHILYGTREQKFKAAGDLDWKMRHATGVAKAPYVAAFVELLLEVHRKVVLFGYHHDVYDIWAKRLERYRPVFYTGKQSMGQKDLARTAFIEGDSRIFIASVRSGAGLDGLQRASSTCVFGELDWSPGMHDQCVGRLNRDGQVEPVLAYFLISLFGSDPVMADILQIKRQQSEPIVNPGGPAFIEVPDAGDRAQRLAEEVMQRRKGLR